MNSHSNLKTLYALKGPQICIYLLKTEEKHRGIVNNFKFSFKVNYHIYSI